MVIDETDNPLGRGAAHLRVDAGTPNWRPDRANKPPSFQLGVKPVCIIAIAPTYGVRLPYGVRPKVSRSAGAAAHARP
eukprot:scaffold108964_cov33-Phaeocystis_antarctica.AAC.2